jgi:hypothetical protein
MGWSDSKESCICLTAADALSGCARHPTKALTRPLTRAPQSVMLVDSLLEATDMCGAWGMC